MSWSKETVTNIVSTITTTIDDGATVADIIYFWDGGPETLKYLFDVVDADVIVSVKDPEETSVRWIQDVPEHHPSVHVVSIISKDKTGVTGTYMQEKMRVQMRATVEAAAQGPDYMLKILRERPRNVRIGGIDKLWWTDYYVEWKDA